MNVNLKEYTDKTAIIEISDKTNSITLYYSYMTVIAIRDIDNKLYISENIYSKTTGKHLNAINSDKKIRLNNKDFIFIANKITSQISLRDNKIAKTVGE